MVRARARGALLRHQRFEATACWITGRVRLLSCSCPLERDEPEQVFFIIGSGRCGMTLVRRMLMSSPTVHIPPETHVLGSIINAYRRYGFLPWEELVTLCLAKLEFHPEYRHFQMPLGPLRERLRRLPRSRRSLARILISVFQEHSKCVGRESAQFFGEKTPASTESVDRIRATFPKGRFVHVVRDGLDVASSYADSGLTDVESAARLWVRRTKIARRFASRHPEIAMTVRYEDLVRQPQEVIAEVASFIGIDPRSVDASTLEPFDIMGDVKQWHHHANVASPVTAERVGRWEGALGSGSLERLERILGRERRRWGYGTDSREGRSGPDDAPPGRRERAFGSGRVR